MRATPRVERTNIGAGLAAIATSPSFGTGNTSRNQPTAPKRITTKPTTLTARLVTNPVNRRARPNEVTNGHGVGAGTSMLFELSDRYSSHGIFHSPPDNVDDGKNDNPDCIDKVPVPRNHLQTLAMHDGYEPTQTKDEYQQQKTHPYNDVAGVQSYECVERRSKQVGANRQSIVIDQLAPLDGGHGEKKTRQHNCRGPEELEETHTIPIESAFSEDDSHAAREQEDRSEHRQIQHLAWGRTRQTL